MYNGNTRRRRKKESNKRNTWNKKDWEFLIINIRQQATDPGSSEKTDEKKCWKLYWGISFYKEEKAKDKEKILKEAKTKTMP